MADQLADLDVEVEEEDESETPDRERGDEEPGSETERTSDDDLFRQAVESLDDDQIREAKFEAPGDGEADESASPEDSPDGAPHEESTVDARMADQLTTIDVEAEELPEEHDTSTDQDREEAPMPDEDVSAREAFEEAIEGMSPAEMRRQKYDMPSAERDESTPGARTEAGEEDAEADGTSDEQAKREELKRRREERKFQDAMRDVEQIEGDQKFRARTAPDPSQYLDETESERTAADFATPTLSKSGQGLHHVSPLNDVQETMVERADAADERGKLRVLNLRGETADDATEMLREFIERCRRDGVQFARIVPGRGKQSDGEPVLKPLVLRWLETRAVDAIRGYAPERSIHGDYGSVIVEFRED
ncbi:MAG: Smr/MutS family protein [Bradymonadaceae bacterium]